MIPFHISSEHSCITGTQPVRGRITPVISEQVEMSSKVVPDSSRDRIRHLSNAQAPEQIRQLLGIEGFPGQSFLNLTDKC